jgi:hypothetical protein
VEKATRAGVLGMRGKGDRICSEVPADMSVQVAPQASLCPVEDKMGGQIVRG